MKIWVAKKSPLKNLGSSAWVLALWLGRELSLKPPEKPIQANTGPVCADEPKNRGNGASADSQGTETAVLKNLDAQEFSIAWSFVRCDPHRAIHRRPLTIWASLQTEKQSSACKSPFAATCASSRGYAAWDSTRERICHASIVAMLTFFFSVWRDTRSKIVYLETLQSIISSVESSVWPIGAVNWPKHSCWNLANFQSTNVAISHHVQVPSSRFKALNIFYC